MNKLYSSFLLLLFLQIGVVSAQYVWTQKANYPGGVRYVAASFSIGAKGYVGTGLDSGINVCKDFWEYDTLSNTWTQKADFGGGLRMGAVAFSIGNFGYMGLGTSSYPSYVWSTDFWKYDPTLNTWTQVGNFPAHGRYATACFTIGNKGYMGCGWYGPEVNDFWEYNPALDTWTQKAAVGGGGRESSIGFAINNKGYITTGLHGGVPTNDLWEYDTLANTWTQKTNFPGTARYGAASFVLCDYAYVGLGSVSYPSQSEKNDFWRYDPSANSWIQIINFPDSARNGVVDFVIGSNAYIGTGAASTALSGFTNGFWKFSSDSCGSVSVLPPVAAFQSSDSIICPYNCINFTNQSINATSWLWSFPGGNPSSSTDQNPQNVCYFSGGDFNVTLIASNIGGSDTLNMINDITVFPVMPTPVIVQSNDTLYCSTDPSYASYQWYFNDSIVSGETNPFYSNIQNGNYNVAVTDTNGCQISVGVILLGLHEAPSDHYANIYPNPVNNELNIAMLKSFNKADVEINDVLGRKLFQRSIETSAGDKLSVDFSGFSPGIYFISVNADGERLSKRIIKESSK